MPGLFRGLGAWFVSGYLVLGALLDVCLLDMRFYGVSSLIAWAFLVWVIGETGSWDLFVLGSGLVLGSGMNLRV